MPVQYVRAAGTSSKCATCDTKLVVEEHRIMWCPKCCSIVDRDVNAAKNILARGVRFAPDGLQSEAVKRFKDAESIVASQKERDNGLIVYVPIT